MKSTVRFNDLMPPTPKKPARRQKSFAPVETMPDYAVQDLMENRILAMVIEADAKTGLLYRTLIASADIFVQESFHRALDRLIADGIIRRSDDGKHLFVGDNYNSGGFF